MAIDKALVLTKEQRSAFKSLERAFKKCHAAGIEIHGELRVLYAVNTSGLDGRRVECGMGPSEVSDDANYFEPACFHGCGADDGVGLI